MQLQKKRAEKHFNESRIFLEQVHSHAKKSGNVK